MESERRKLTEQRQRIIVEAIAAGCPKYFAAQKASITYTCYKDWMKRGRREQDDPDSIYAAFSAAVQKAEAEAVARNAELIQQVAMDGTWQAAAWWLERRYPEEFGNNRHEITELRKRIEELERTGAHHFGAQAPPAPTRNGSANSHAAH